jgi:hypothetical protein
MMNGKPHPPHPPRPTSDDIACDLTSAFLQNPQRAKQARRAGLRPEHFPEPLQEFFEGITAPKPNLEKLRRDLPSETIGRVADRCKFSDHQIPAWVNHLIDGGATIGLEDQLLGLMIKHGVRPSTVRLGYEHFQHPDLGGVFEQLCGAEAFSNLHAPERYLTADHYRKELVTHPNDHTARLVVWLVDYAARTALDPDNPLEDPREIIDRLAEQIRGRNEASPPPSPDQKPTTTAPAPTKPGLIVSPDAEILGGDRSLEWNSAASEMPGLTHLERSILWYISGRINAGEHGTGISVPVSISTIAKVVGADRRNVQHALDHVVELGLLAVHRGGGKLANKYQLALPKAVIEARKKEAERKKEVRSVRPESPPKGKKRFDLKATGCRIPPDWMPSTEDQTWAINRIGVDKATSELDRFKNYWLASDDPKKAVKSNWNAAWRYWVTNDFAPRSREKKP